MFLLSLDLLELVCFVCSVRVPKFSAIKVLLEFRKVAIYKAYVGKCCLCMYLP